MQHEEILGFFSRYIEKEIGIVYASHNHFQLSNRLDEICKLSGTPTVLDLYNQAQSGITGAFKQLLLDVATNNETSFFRDPKVFKAIESLLKEQPAKPASAPFKIWSAASSTGQEALSVAIILAELNAKRTESLEYRLLASDICERALDKAKKAVYSQLEVQRGLPAPYMIKYFSKDDQDRWTVKPGLNKSIQYRNINLNDFVVSHEKYDLILCRNVLIYQSVENKKKVITTLTDSLAEGGFLVLGSGESLLGLSDAFTQQSIEGAILYRKKVAQTRAA